MRTLEGLVLGLFRAIACVFFSFTAQMPSVWLVVASTMPPCKAIWSTGRSMSLTMVESLRSRWSTRQRRRRFTQRRWVDKKMKEKKRGMIQFCVPFWSRWHKFSLLWLLSNKSSSHSSLCLFKATVLEMESFNILIARLSLSDDVQSSAVFFSDFLHGPDENEGDRRSLPRKDRYERCHHRSRLFQWRATTGHQGRWYDCWFERSENHQRADCCSHRLRSG